MLVANTINPPAIKTLEDLANTNTIAFWEKIGLHSQCLTSELIGGSGDFLVIVDDEIWRFEIGYPACFCGHASDLTINCSLESTGLDSIEELEDFVFYLDNEFPSIRVNLTTVDCLSGAHWLMNLPSIKRAWENALEFALENSNNK